MNVVLDAFYSLGRNLNKTQGAETALDTAEGIVSEKMPELTLEMDDADIIKLTDQWEKEWEESDVKTTWAKRGEENENYWLGKHYQKPEVDKTRALIDNVLFKALETYLPQITRQDPEATVEISGNPENVPPIVTQYVRKIQEKLGQIVDEIRLRVKLKKAGRHWALYLVAVMKSGWDISRDMPTVKVIRPQKMIFDPNATVDEDGYTGNRIGEYRKLEAGLILDIIGEGKGTEEARKAIKDLVKDDLGTEVQFIEWWTPHYMCWKMGKKVLLKKKNPNWNYDEPTPAQPEQAEGATNEQGVPLPPQPAPQPIKGVNHWTSPRMPYRLLSVFNLGKQPVDDTSLMGQNLSNQDIINKRMKQIDKNADSMNNGIVVSLEKSGLTTQQAKGVTEALRKGGTIAIPTGSAQDAIYRPQLPTLPDMIYDNLQDTRNEVEGIFGTQGSTPQGVKNTETAKGQILMKQMDTDRIGGGITEYIEQLADDVVNDFVQLLYVYDDEFHALLQGLPSSDPQTGQQSLIPLPKLKVSIKEGSMLPKDATSLANQAISLANEGKMALKDLYQRLDYPNPEELAANVWLEANAPELLYADNPLVQKAVQMKQQAQAAQQQAAAEAEQAKSAKKPIESIAFKDLPPDGKVQLAAQAGIVLHPEGIAAHDQHKEVRDTAHAIALKVASPPPQPDIGGGGSP
jgi:hypothetical protein